MNAHEFTFVRFGKFNSIENLWVVEILHRPEMGLADALTALGRGVAEWIEKHAVGQKAWEESCHDLNIADLMCHCKEHYLPYLKRHGITDIRIVYQLVEGEQVDFDAVLPSLADD